MSVLLPHQINALNFIRGSAERISKTANDYIFLHLREAKIHATVYRQILSTIKTHARIALHFHPERICRQGYSVAEGLLRDGCFKNQFETGISNGSPTAFPGGERDEWERILFGGAYHHSVVKPEDRPKYGALRLMHYPDGVSPRFGSCYFILHQEVSQRSSFTFGGSQDDLELKRSGTLDQFDPVMAAIIKELVTTKSVLGKQSIQLTELLSQFDRLDGPYPEDWLKKPLGNALDSFVEAQIHGAVGLEKDVDQLLADPSFLNTSIEPLLEAICETYNIQLHWHPGYTLPVRDFPDEFRGYATRPLAEHIQKDNWLNAAVLGEASNAFFREPELWKRFGSYTEVLTIFRRLWHILVKYGQPLHP